MGYEKIYHCYHGTTDEFGTYVVSNKEFTYEHRENHWLGNGVYFFIDDRLKARWWAKMAVRKEKRKEPSKNVTDCVLYLEAKTDIDKVIDLNIESGQKTYFEFISYLKENNVELEVKVDKKLTKHEQEHYFRCAIMDLLVKSEDYDASCYLFQDSRVGYNFEDLDGYGIVNNKGNQICIYNQSIINFDSLVVCEQEV